MQRRTVVDADARGADDRSERRHRRHRPDTERGSVADGRGSRRQRERGKDAEEMRAAGDAVQNAHAERRVRVADLPCPIRTGVHVHVIVLDRAVVVSAGGNVQRTTECPQSDSDERNADDAFAPGGKHIDRRQQVAQDDRQQRHDDDAGGVAESPGPARQPSTTAVFYGELRNGGKMVRTREDMKQPGHQAG